MKKVLLAILLSVSMSAHANTWEMNNEAGGKIVLTTRPCIVNGNNYERLNEAYSYTANGSMIEGCWLMLDNMVQVIWRPNGDRRVYDPKNFRKVGESKQNNSNRYGT